MPQYTATYKISNTSDLRRTYGSGIPGKRSVKRIFSARNVAEAIDTANQYRETQNAYFDKYKSDQTVFVMKLTSLKVIGAGYSNDPRYDPKADLCDDCYRPFWMGHNPRVEH